MLNNAPRAERPSIIKGPQSPPLLGGTFNDVLREQSTSRAEATAILCPHQSLELTFHQLQHRSQQLAAGLHSIGVGAGDRIAILLGNRFEYIEVFLACAKLGAYATLINYAYSPSELHGAILSTMPKVLFATLTTSRYNYGSALAELSDTIDSLEQIVILEDISSSQRLLPLQPGYLRYDEILERGSRNTIEIDNLERRIKSDAILNLQFTSGSTGAPKAAALTHRGMLNSARYIGLQMSVSHQDKIVIPVPLFHAFGLVMGVCCALVQGATIVLPSEYFDAAATLQAVDRLQCTGLYGVTTMFIDEMSHRQFLKTKRSTLRFGIMAGSAMPEELLSRVMSTFPIPALFTNWGMTELSSVATMTTATDPVSKKMKTAGRLLPNFVAKIVEPDTGRVLPWGQRGEIVVSGFGVMHSYYGNPEQTRKTIQVHEEDLLPNQAGADAQGRLRRWMHTGDEGYLDEEGYFVITGRIKDLIIRGGENISPLEIESRLYDHPAIKQAVVFGVPNERYGEAVAAMLELQDGREVRPSDQEIKAWVRASLSRYKVPVHIWWLGDQDSGDPKPVAKDRQREAEKT